MTESAKPTATLSQKITAGAAVFAAIGAAVAAGVGIYAVQTVHDTADSVFEAARVKEGPSFVKQGLCLPYTEFVLNQHRAGLSPAQISATLDAAIYDRGVQGGVNAPKPKVNEPLINSLDACGLPHEIIEAATK